MTGQRALLWMTLGLVTAAAVIALLAFAPWEPRSRASPPAAVAAASLPATAPASEGSRAPRQQPASADPASALRASQAARSWAAMNSQAQIAQVIELARQSKDVDLQAAAAYALGLCTAIQSPPETRLEDLKLLLGGLLAADYEQLLREMQASLAALQRFCRSGAGQDYVPLLRRKEIRRIDAYQYPPAKGAAVNLPDMRQWDAVFLGSPEQYPYGVERWMERRLKSLIPAEMAADDAAVEWLRRDLLQRLTHLPADDQIGSHYACLYRWICPMRLQFSPGDLAELRQVAQDIELRIRQQRWDQLGLK